jgi:aryl-alcohol dehydrogenase-like predicted oxidoreductase
VIGGLVGTFFNRDDVVIATKAGVTFPEGVRTVNNSRHFLISELEKSLTRLGTDYVDIWQIHSWDAHVALEDTLSALDFAYTSGKARYVGISNFNGWQSARAISLQEANTAKAPIATIQSEYSLLNRSIEQGRADDTEDVIRRRLDLYEEQTAPLTDVYASRGLLITIDGLGEVEEVTARIMEAINAKLNSN